MARDKSEYKSGINKAARAFTKLIEAVEDAGGGDEHIALIETDEALRRDLAKRIVGQKTNGLGDTYTVTVDRDKKLKAMIEAGRYDRTDLDITDKRFPVKGSGTVEIDIELVHYGRYMSTDAVLKDLDARGLRPIRIEELLAPGCTKPELQREFPIIALGSVWLGLDGGRRCPGLYGYGSERHLFLGWLGNDVDEVCRFAAVRK